MHPVLRTLSVRVEMLFHRLLSGPFDERGAVVAIQAGAGGADAMDWAELLERMYCRCGGKGSAAA